MERHWLVLKRILLLDQRKVFGEEAMVEHHVLASPRPCDPYQGVCCSQSGSARRRRRRRVTVDAALEGWKEEGADWENQTRGAASQPMIIHGVETRIGAKMKGRGIA